jgi:tetrapyrrole methylase family protein/MazG family protein
MDELLKKFRELIDVIVTLRSPNGCPWDREQSPASMKRNLIEEAYECIEAIGNEDVENIKEELGDLLLVTLMIAYMYEQNGLFSQSDVFKDITNKLIRRHPHVFSSSSANTSEEVIQQWETIKSSEKGKHNNSVLSSIPLAMPPLERSYKIQKKVSHLGFDWLDIKDVKRKVYEEMEEVETASARAEQSEILEECGDLLFSVINYIRFLRVDPSEALDITNKKFMRRFKYIENEMTVQEKSLNKDNFYVMDQLWDESKDNEKDI